MSSDVEDVSIRGMRKRYKEKGESFTEDSISCKDPIVQFKNWFDDACNTPDVYEANAMVLATATKSGMPSARPVLLKGYGREGFKFYTHYTSRKGQELEENPNAALTFFWEPLNRVIRIEGTVTKTSKEDSDSYFKCRPIELQVGSAASYQSTVVPSREFLLEKESKLWEDLKENELERPENWGGYLVTPRSIEFWQGQSNRLHDRIKFRRLNAGETPDNVLTHQGENGWAYERLSP